MLLDLKGVFEANPGKNVSIAFMNTSLNSFLPPPESLFQSNIPSSNEDTGRSLLHDLARRTNTSPQDCVSLIESLRDANPLLGVKGCRYALVNPEFFRMQVCAALGAGLQVIREGHTRMGTIQFMIPMVTSEHETLAIVNEIKTIGEEFFAQHVRFFGNDFHMQYKYFFALTSVELKSLLCCDSISTGRSEGGLFNWYRGADSSASE